jgi:hypothetical protein
MFSYLIDDSPVFALLDQLHDTGKSAVKWFVSLTLYSALKTEYSITGLSSPSLTVPPPGTADENGKDNSKATV